MSGGEVKGRGPAMSISGGQDPLKERVADALRLARELGATQAEASASFGTGFSVNVRMREVETLRHQRDQGLGVTVWFGHRKGSASSSDLRPAAVEETVRKACSLARYAAEDPCWGSPMPSAWRRRFPISACITPGLSTRRPPSCLRPTARRPRWIRIPA